MAFVSGRTYPEWVAHWPEVEYFDPHFGESSTGGIRVIEVPENDSSKGRHPDRRWRLEFARRGTGPRGKANAIRK